MNEENEVVKIVEKPFLNTFIDAIMYAKKAEETKDEYLIKLLSKASILHCSFAVEALANNMLQFLKVQGKLADSLDRLDIIAKLDLFSFIVKKRNIDRGSRPIQIFQELITIRNNYVHPKIQSSDLETMVKEDTIITIKEHKLSNNLKVNICPNIWGAKDARQSIALLVESVDEFLLNELKMEKKSLTCMFLNSKIKDAKRTHLVRLDTEWLDWLKNDLKKPPRFYTENILVRIRENKINKK